MRSGTDTSAQVPLIGVRVYTHYGRSIIRSGPSLSLLVSIYLAVTKCEGFGASKNFDRECLENRKSERYIIMSSMHLADALVTDKFELDMSSTTAF